MTRDETKVEARLCADRVAMVMRSGLDYSVELRRGEYYVARAWRRGDADKETLYAGTGCTEQQAVERLVARVTAHEEAVG